MTTSLTMQARERLRPAHRLEPLFRPHSIAVIGASRRRGSTGNDVLRDQLVTGYCGAVYPVNPRYRELYGRPCFAAMGDLPHPVDLAVLAVPSAALDGALADAIRHGARAAVIFASGSVPEDRDPKLSRRLAAAAREAGMALLGPSVMGFYNLDAGIRAFSLHFPRPLEKGGIAFITQAGAMMMPFLFNDPRLRYNLAASTGLEVGVDVADAMDYAVAQPTTRVIALVLETVRRPGAFLAALDKAAERGIPIVALKLGRTEAAAKLAVSHTGAIAGNDKVYDAVFRRHGVLRVRDMRELAATAYLLSHYRDFPPGGLAAILDSGGERELLIDLAADIGLPFAQIGDDTVAVLRSKLDHGLEPVNPLDAWGTGNNYEDVVFSCLDALMSDRDSAAGLFVTDLTDGIDLHEGYLEVLGALKQKASKPLMAITNLSAWSHRGFAMRLDRLGIPVFDSAPEALAAIRHAFAYRDGQAGRRRRVPAEAPSEAAERWRERLQATAAPLTEAEGYALLSDYGIPVPAHAVVGSRTEAVAAAERIGFPVALKTAMPGIAHKSEAGGVRLGLSHAAAVARAYDEMAARLGPSALVAEQVPAAAELALGLLHDPGFGPFLMLASGGVWIELHGDAVLCPVPVPDAELLRLVQGLKIRPVLEGARGGPVTPAEAVADLIRCLSRLVQDLGECIAELDINPVRISGSRLVAADCLVVPANGLHDGAARSTDQGN
jgi:acyl-CoA synthetase (NDP forming)